MDHRAGVQSMRCSAVIAGCANEAMSGSNAVNPLLSLDMEK
jgi:hypothetical protein